MKKYYVKIWDETDKDDRKLLYAGDCTDKERKIIEAFLEEVDRTIQK